MLRSRGVNSKEGMERETCEEKMVASVQVMRIMIITEKIEYRLRLAKKLHHSSDSSFLKRS